MTNLIKMTFLAEEESLDEEIEVEEEELDVLNCVQYYTTLYFVKCICSNYIQYAALISQIRCYEC
jgi:hypothetical protein